MDIPDKDWTKVSQWGIKDTNHPIHANMVLYQSPKAVVSAEVYAGEDVVSVLAVKGRVVSDEWVELINTQVFMTHVGTFTELQRADGGYRLFFPMNVNTYRKKEVPIFPKGSHDSICFYSNDESRTWKQSNWISTVLESYNGLEPIDWAWLFAVILQPE